MATRLDWTFRAPEKRMKQITKMLTLPLTFSQIKSQMGNIWDDQLADCLAVLMDREKIQTGYLNKKRVYALPGVHIDRVKLRVPISYGSSLNGARARLGGNTGNSTKSLREFNPSDWVVK